MNAFLTAFWAESLKARRSKISWLTAAAYMFMPAVGGLFMFILKDPEQAKSMGLISAKAQMTAAVADWPTFFMILSMGIGTAGSVLFAIITTWIFGREFSDHTVKNLLSLPISRGILVGAKFALALLWILGLTLVIFLVSLGIGALVNIPGWSTALAWHSLTSLMLAVFLITLLMSFVAFFASVGRGYLPPIGWAFLMMGLAQIASVLGWADWFPWAVPTLFFTINGPRTAPVALHSYLVVLLTCLSGAAATFLWWRRADQTR